MLVWHYLRRVVVEHFSTPCSSATLCRAVASRSAEVYKIRKWQKLGTKIVDLTWSWEKRRESRVRVYMCMCGVDHSFTSLETNSSTSMIDSALDKD